MNKKEIAFKLYLKTYGYDEVEYKTVMDALYEAFPKSERFTYSKKGKKFLYKDVDNRENEMLLEYGLGDSGRKHIYQYKLFDGNYYDFSYYIEYGYDGYIPKSTSTVNIYGESYDEDYAGAFDAYLLINTRGGYLVYVDDGIVYLPSSIFDIGELNNTKSNLDFIANL